MEQKKIELYSVIPPKAVQVNFYRTDDHFWTDHLKNMLNNDKVIRILAIDIQEAGLGILTGDKWEILILLLDVIMQLHQSICVGNRMLQLQINWHLYIFKKWNTFTENYRMDR